jgi:hypothetical protein
VIVCQGGPGREVLFGESSNRSWVGAGFDDAVWLQRVN